MNYNELIISDDLILLDDEGKTALCYAMYHDNIQFCKFLISHGADVNVVCEAESGNTAEQIHTEKYSYRRPIE